MWWRIKDWLINTGLKVRLWFYITFIPKRFKGVSNPLTKKGWELTFNDEFDQGKLDRAKWRTDAYYGLRFHPGSIIDKDESPTVYYGDNLFEFEGSVIKQKMTNESKTITWRGWDGADEPKNYKIPYRAGQLDSSKSFEQKYGYFEIRSKITPEPGTWPAFWLASTYGWPPEIDMYEIYTGKEKGMVNFESNFHWMPAEIKKDEAKKHRVLNVSEDFHLYAVDWSEKGFKIYYDNMLVRVFSNPEAIKFFEHPMHIIIGTGPDMRENGESIASANFPNYHEVDYVRAYKKE